MLFVLVCRRVGLWTPERPAIIIMCTEKKQFVNYTQLYKPEMVSLGDGRKLKAAGRETVLLSVDEVTCMVASLSGVVWKMFCMFQILGTI